MRSMTGYGHFFSKNDRYEVEVEVKSVNGRYFDVNIQADNSISHLEKSISDIISQYIKRGRVSAKIFVTDKQEQNLELDEEYLKHLYSLHREAEEVLNTAEKISVQDFLKFDGVLKRRINKINDDDFMQTLEATLKQCLTTYNDMTMKEGRQMEIWISESIDRIGEALHLIEAEIPAYREKIKKKLLIAVKDILEQKSDDYVEKRILTEVSFYVDKADVTEELTRIKDHISKVKETIVSHVKDPGRKLNFIFQEIHREIQTTGSKFNSVAVFPYILQIKEEVEKCRELVQNVE